MPLEVENLHAAYGSTQVLFGIDLKIGNGEVVALLGRNGVGKTTCMRCIMGLTRPQRGAVRWRGEDIAGAPPHKIARSGIGLVPQERRIFADLTVWENLDMGRRPGTDPDREEYIDRLFPELGGLADRRGGTLSGGQQQLLSIARSLMGGSHLLLLDEPSEGLAPRMVERLGQQLAELRQQGVAMLLAEQNLDFALELSDRAYIVEKGTVCYSGSAAELRADEEAQRRFLTL